MKSGSILETRSLIKEYRSRRVVDQVNLQVQGGSIVGLLGPNGAGKTTTFYSIVGFIRPTAGSVYLDGKNITTLPIHRRASRGITYMAQEPVNMREVISETLAILQPQAAERQVSIALQVPETLPTIIGDADRLKQVMVNLVSNAVKYNHEGGRVDIEIQVGEDELNVAVKDTGRGIAEEDLPHVFEKFYRVDDPEQQTKGTGLGLPVAQHIVKVHGGTISVQSVQGQGSTFAFTLPLPKRT